MGAIKAAIGDVLLTFMWVFSASTLGLFTTLIANAIGLHGHQLWPSLCITTSLVFFLVFVFTLIGDALGGASFNPTGTASFYAAGVGPDTLFSMALRFPAQVHSISISISPYQLLDLLCSLVFSACLITPLTVLFLTWTGFGCCGWSSGH